VIGQHESIDWRPASYRTGSVMTQMMTQMAGQAVAGAAAAMLPCKEKEAEFREAMVVLVRSLPGLPPAVSGCAAGFLCALAWLRRNRPRS
jgi:hypothetical protein